jgi:GTPase SAR1 family protein
VNLSLWDTTAQENYERLRPLAYSRAHVILLCFRANNPTATTKSSILQKWAPELMRYCPGAPIILVGLNHPNDSDDDETEPILPEKSDETTKHSPIKLLHTTDASASGSGPRIKHNEQSGTERRQNQEEEEPFIPFSIRREIGSPEYFFCDPITGFGVDELFEYVRGIPRIKYSAL